MQSLPVRSVVNEAAQVIWRKRATLFPALIGSGFVLAILETASFYIVGEHPRGVLIALLGIARAVVATWFAVTCHRVVLLDDGATPRYGIHSWSGREMRFLGWTLVGVFCLFVGVVPVAIPAGIIAGGRDFFSDYPMLWLPVAIPGAYVSARLSVLLPATAVGERFDMSWAWKTTSGNGWRLLVVVGLLPFLFDTLIEDIEAVGFVALAFIVRVVGCALLAFEIAALSISFRFLTRQANNEEVHNAAPLAG